MSNNNTDSYKQPYAILYSASILTLSYIIIEGITIHAISYFNILVIADRIIYAVPCHSYGK